ncbi:Inosine-uridine preferring nucleoside hydrolase [Nitrospira tepida]|uniref:Inosine-uridine preferring nucleoside hydrolase n=1 Tax=Nitrospira tepida TaxID=2973512 RepID=A0AA86MW22_9BACT|nr:nucleoside hydrolase [Nitrospira tepida]CAI4030078.1 Inosine-uridine preferring nucleoside hydrolase [Nitrospira tepida]
MPTARRRKVILDTDPGVDDALAILLALRSPELDVVGITTICGNVPVGQATENLFRILSLVDPPRGLLIGQGAAAPLRRPLETATHVHGADGLGDLDQFTNQSGQPRYPRPVVPGRLPSAVETWERCMRTHGPNLTLITLGPLTNLAQALQRPAIVAKGFRSIIAMAGAIAVPGNVTRAAEFNVYVDPHAAEQVLQADLPLTLIPLDVTTKVTVSREAITKLTARARDPVGQFFADATGAALDFADRVEGAAVFPFHDPLAVAVAIDPALVQLVPLHVAVETEGPVALGATLADRRRLRREHQNRPNVQVALRVQADRARRLITERLCRTSS